MTKKIRDSISMLKRYDELDSIRGLAALTVVLGHYYNVYRSSEIVKISTENVNFLIASIIKFSPLHLFWAGHEAVILFFILSGFVLSLPYYGSRHEPSYTTYIVKRFLRIYVPYIVAISFSALLRIVFSEGGIPELTYWFNVIWVEPITMENIINHILLIGDYNTGTFNGVTWSLVHEMRISLVFPFVVLFLKKINSFYAVAIAFGLSWLSFYFIDYYRIGNINNIFYSLHYLSYFMIGSTLSKHRDKIATFYCSKKSYIKSAIVLIAIFLYTYKWSFFYNIKEIHSVFINDWIICLGASSIIGITLSSGLISNLLRNNSVTFLGKISYSLYLYHVAVQFTFIYLLYSKIPLLLILFLSLAVTLIISFLSYKFIELPSINLGRKIVMKNEK